jgi:carbamate kinase
MKNKLAVVALGGNAILRGDQAGTIDEQEQNTTETLENLVFLIMEGYDLVITHGYMTLLRCQLIFVWPTLRVG